MINLKIITHSGSVYDVQIDSYDPLQINKDLNDNNLNTVAFADVILSRIDIKAVVPIIL